jgi:hypothetical protein
LYDKEENFKIVKVWSKKNKKQIEISLWYYRMDFKTYETIPYDYVLSMAKKYKFPLIYNIKNEDALKLIRNLQEYRLVSKSNHPFLVLKGVTEMSFLVLKRSGNSEEN